MSPAWPVVRLETLLDFANGRSSPERSEGATFPVYGSNGQIGFAGEFNAAANTIVIGRVGSFCGSLFFIKTNCWVTDNAIKATAREPNDPRFLYYLLMGLDLHRWRGGSGQPLLNQSTLNTISTPIPPPAVQRHIGAILGDLDDKIDLNRRMNETLEATARAIFQSWFVDFDPVRAKAEGRQPLGMDGETAALFPDSFDESEMGQIPKGWDVRAIGDLVDAVGGATPSTKESSYWDGKISFATPKDMSSLSAPILLGTERHITEEGVAQIGSGILPKGTVLLSSRAPIGYLAITDIPVAVNQGVIAMICTQELPNYFVLNWTAQNMETIIGRANGTTFLEISKKNFRPIKVVVPPAGLLQRFTEIVEPLYNQITMNLKETQTLMTLRDTLLPKLLSGELSLPRT